MKKTTKKFVSILILTCFSFGTASIGYAQADQISGLAMDTVNQQYPSTLTLQANGDEGVYTLCGETALMNDNSSLTAIADNDSSGLGLYRATLENGEKIVLLLNSDNSLQRVEEFEVVNTNDLMALKAQVEINDVLSDAIESAFENNADYVKVYIPRANTLAASGSEFTYNGYTCRYSVASAHSNGGGYNTIATGANVPNVIANLVVNVGLLGSTKATIGYIGFTTLLGLSGVTFYSDAGHNWCQAEKIENKTMETVEIKENGVFYPRGYSEFGTVGWRVRESHQVPYSGGGYTNVISEPAESTVRHSFGKAKTSTGLAKEAVNYYGVWYGKTMYQDQYQWFSFAGTGAKFMSVVSNWN